MRYFRAKVYSALEIKFRPKISHRHDWQPLGLRGFRFSGLGIKVGLLLSGKGSPLSGFTSGHNFLTLLSGASLLSGGRYFRAFASFGGSLLSGFVTFGISLLSEVYGM